MYKIQIQLLLQEKRKKKRKKEENSHVTIGEILDLILVLLLLSCKTTYGKLGARKGDSRGVAAGTSAGAKGVALPKAPPPSLAMQHS